MSNTAPEKPWLLTPGPLTTTRTVKEAMLFDWGSRDSEFIDMCAYVRDHLVELVHGEDRYATVCMQGSGTFAIEATIGTLVPPTGKLLVLVNGAYGHRMVKIAKTLGRKVAFGEWAEDQVPDAATVGQLLEQHADATHVAIVHCETTSGILNPIEDIAALVAEHGKPLIIDAMSAFGAIELDSRKTPFAAVVASTNKCLEGVPGMGFAIVRKSDLSECQGNCHSLALDLYEQWVYTDRTGQWRFTPPIHVIAAFQQALREHSTEGGVAGRGARYANNCRVLVGGMRELGFETLLPDEVQAPIIVTFKEPGDAKYDFAAFYEYLREKNFVIYPGKLTEAASFRMGCIGALDETHMRGAVDAVRWAMSQLGMSSGAPPAA
ncbi:MAG: 2-aminoethylphosphonate--pyruvate transaminase [Myxococcales bacterium]|nr:2-aminoethylphosphonate--pyruvate transaminase [Myxococcales bacterium]